MTKVKKVFLIIIPIVAWITIWQFFAHIVNNTFLLPDVMTTFDALGKIAQSDDFLKTILLTLSRVVRGLLLGVLSGIIFAILTHYSQILC